MTERGSAVLRALKMTPAKARAIAWRILILQHELPEDYEVRPRMRAFAKLLLTEAQGIKPYQPCVCPRHTDD